MLEWLLKIGLVSRSNTRLFFVFLVSLLHLGVLWLMFFLVEQAYSPMPPHGYVASSPQPHPYVWSVQVNRIVFFRWF